MGLSQGLKVIGCHTSNDTHWDIWGCWVKLLVEISKTLDLCKEKTHRQIDRHLLEYSRLAKTNLIEFITI